MTRPKDMTPAPQEARWASGRLERSARRALVALVATCFAGGLLAPRVSAAEPEPTAGETTPGETTETPEPAAAPRADLDTLVRVIQQRPVLKSGRFELLAGAGLVLNDDMYDHWLATATGRVHVSEWISIGATYAKYFSDVSDLQREIASDYEVYPELSAIRWYAGGDVTFVAFEGKFVFFDSAIAYWDLYASIGGGVTVTSRGDDPKPTGMVGAGLRLYLTEWLTLGFELKDHIFVEKFAAGSSLVNNVVGQAGLTIFIPFGFDYEYEK